MNRSKFISFSLAIALMLLALTFSTSVPASFLGIGKDKEEQAPVVEEVQEEDLSVLAQRSKEEADTIRYRVDAFKKAVKLREEELDRAKKKAGAAKQVAEAARQEYDLLKAKSKNDKTLKKAASDANDIAKAKKKEARIAENEIKVVEKKLETAIKELATAQAELEGKESTANIAEQRLREKRNLLYKKLIHTASVILIGYLFIFLFSSIANRRFKDLKQRHLLRRNTGYFVHIIMVAYLLFFWVQDIGSIVIFFSVVSAGIILALQDIILSLAGWLVILIRRPFDVGDRIELGGIKGDVIAIHLLETSLLELGNWIDADQSTGRIVNIPNSAIFKKENHNYSRGFEYIWNEIPLVVTFESSWQRAKEIMVKHSTEEAADMSHVVKEKLEEMSRHYMIPTESLVPTVYVEIKDSGVELTLRYLTKARERRATEDRLCQKILLDFDREENVNFAYTTYRLVR
jgi:small-conductance mechanosensitive channel